MSRSTAFPGRRPTRGWSSHATIGCLREDLRQRSADVAEDPAIRDDRDVAETSVRERAELATTHLQFTKLYTASFGPASVNDIPRETAASARSLAAGIGLADLHVVTDLGPSVPEREIDAGQMKMAFFNLTKNAVEVLKERAVSNPCLTLKSASSSGRAGIHRGQRRRHAARDCRKPVRRVQDEEGGWYGLVLAITKKIVHGSKTGYSPLVTVAKEVCVDKSRYDAAGERGLIRWLEYFVLRG